MPQFHSKPRPNDLIPILFALMICPTPSQALEPDKLFETLAPSAVWINVPLQNGFNVGSGVVIAPETVLTACSILVKGKSISVKSGKDFHEASLQFSDNERDLCQIKAPGLKAPAVKTITSNKLRVGQRIYAIANPEGADFLFSEGLISGLRGTEANRIILTSVPVTHASSGAGLFDDQGRLLGITRNRNKDGAGIVAATSADVIADLPKRGNELPATTTKPAANDAKPVGTVSQNQVAEQPAEQKATFPRKLSGDEIAAHFKPGRELLANSSGREFSIDFMRNGREARRYCTSCGIMRYAYARLTFKPALGQACFKWENLSYYPDDGCFEVLQIAEGKYRMESRERVQPIEYRVVK